MWKAEPLRMVIRSARPERFSPPGFSTRCAGTASDAVSSPFALAAARVSRWRLKRSDRAHPTLARHSHIALRAAHLNGAAFQLAIDWPKQTVHLGFMEL